MTFEHFIGCIFLLSGDEEGPGRGKGSEPVVISIAGVIHDYRTFGQTESTSYLDLRLFAVRDGDDGRPVSVRILRELSFIAPLVRRKEGHGNRGRHSFTTVAFRLESLFLNLNLCLGARG